MSNFVLRLGAGPTVIDFRGPNRWGHALHASFWTSLGRPSRPWWDLLARYRDHRDNVRRHSFLCHVQGPVKEGQTVLWTTKHGDAEGIVVQVEGMRDPPDMYKLVVEVRGDGLHRPRPPEHVNCRSVMREGL